MVVAGGSCTTQVLTEYLVDSTIFSSLRLFVATTAAYIFYAVCRNTTDHAAHSSFLDVSCNMME